MIENMIFVMFYQVESILIHSEKLENFLLQKFFWNTVKMAKILQHLKTLKICQLQHAEHPLKDHTSLAGPNQNLLFFGPPYINTCFDLTNLKANAKSKKPIHNQ